MKIVVQRVTDARVSVNRHVVGMIGSGLLIFVGISRDDTESVASRMSKKIANLRIFSDDQGKMNRSVLEVDGEILAVPQFTLFAELKGQNRPYFGEAAAPEKANQLFEFFISQLQQGGIQKVAKGEFGAYMQVELTNDGPVTLLLDSGEV